MVSTVGAAAQPMSDLMPVSRLPIGGELSESCECRLLDCQWDHSSFQLRKRNDSADTWSWQLLEIVEVARMDGVQVVEGYMWAAVAGDIVATKRSWHVKNIMNTRRRAGETPPQKGVE